MHSSETFDSGGLGVGEASDSGVRPAAGSPRPAADGYSGLRTSTCRWQVRARRRTGVQEGRRGGGGPIMAAGCRSKTYRTRVRAASTVATTVDPSRDRLFDAGLILS